MSFATKSYWSPNQPWACLVLGVEVHPLRFTTNCWGARAAVWIVVSDVLEASRYHWAVSAVSNAFNEKLAPSQRIPAKSFQLCIKNWDFHHLGGPLTFNVWDTAGQEGEGTADHVTLVEKKWRFSGVWWQFAVFYLGYLRSLCPGFFQLARVVASLWAKTISTYISSVSEEKFGGLRDGYYIQGEGHPGWICQNQVPFPGMRKPPYGLVYFKGILDVHWGAGDLTHLRYSTENVHASCSAMGSRSLKSKELGMDSVCRLFGERFKVLGVEIRTLFLYLGGMK